jgi:CBS domain-containing protein
MANLGTVAAILERKGRTVWSVTPQTTVFEAIAFMAEKNIGALPVLEQGRLAGILSERDYTRKVALKGRSSRETLVKEILSGQVMTARMDTTVEECMHLMTEHHVRHLPVLEADQVVGMVSIGDLVYWIISAQRATISQLHSYIQGHLSE